jgi:hypothetical protein
MPRVVLPALSRTQYATTCVAVLTETVAIACDGNDAVFVSATVANDDVVLHSASKASVCISAFGPTR